MFHCDQLGETLPDNDTKQYMFGEVLCVLVSKSFGKTLSKNFTVLTKICVTIHSHKMLIQSRAEVDGK